MPVIAPVAAPPNEGVTASVETAALIHVPFALHVTLPAVAFGVAEILAVVEVPVQPPGKVQVYDVAPATAATEYVFAAP